MSGGTARLLVTFELNCPEDDILGVKEALGVLLEWWGDVRLVSVREVREDAPEQMRIGWTEKGKGRYL